MSPNPVLHKTKVSNINKANINKAKPSHYEKIKAQSVAARTAARAKGRVANDKKTS